MEERGARISKKGEMIINVLRENYDKHLTVEEIFAILKERDNNIGIATVYRNLKQLEEKELVKKAYITDNLSSCYEVNIKSNIHSHHHLICKQCGKIIDFEEDLLDVIEKIIDVTTGFQIYDHNLVFYGKCKDCNNNDLIERNFN